LLVSSELPSEPLLPIDPGDPGPLLPPAS
jgi:hypothetical protein